MAQENSLVGSPKAWWQWMLVYSPVPLAIIALFQSLLIGWLQNSVSANQPKDIISKNIDCISSPEFLAKRQTPVPIGSGTKVSAILCDSGYLALYIVPRTSDDGAYRFVELKTLLHHNVADIAKVNTNIQTSTPVNFSIEWLEQPAIAAIVNLTADTHHNITAIDPKNLDLLANKAIDPVFQVAQLPQVVCSKIEGNRFVRRIQYTDHCETETIDLNTGNVLDVTSNPGSCSADCG